MSLFFLTHGVHSPSSIYLQCWHSRNITENSKYHVTELDNSKLQKWTEDRTETNMHKA